MYSISIPAEENDGMIKQHNAITEARVDFTACQLDILFMLLAHLKEDDEDYTRYLIRVKDIERITGRNWNYQQVSDSTENMLGRVYEVKDPRGKKQIVLFSEVQYLEGKGAFEMVINPPAIPLFFNLKNTYTLMELKSVLNCTSKHAKRIYSICCQWRNVKKKGFPLGEFKEMLGLKDPKGIKKEQYTILTTFRREVLDVAKKQINGNTDITFDYELEKRFGRKTDWITIWSGVSKPSSAQVEIDFNISVDEQKNKAELLRKKESILANGISEKLADLWAEKYWKQFVSEKNQLLDDIKNGKDVKDFSAYLVGIFKAKGYV